MAGDNKTLDDLVDTLRQSLPGKKKKDSLFGAVFNYLDNLQNKPPPAQMGIGGGAGLVTGYLFTKGSKATATVLGVSLIVFQFCNYRGYIKLNRSKFESDLRDLKRGIEKELLGKSSEFQVREKDVVNFLSSNAYLLGGFAAGWLLGFGLA